MIAHDPIHMSMEQIIMEWFRKCIRDICFCRDPSHANNIAFNPFLYFEVFDIHMPRSFSRLFSIGHKESTLVVYEKSSGKFLRHPNFIENGANIANRFGGFTGGSKFSFAT